MDYSKYVNRKTYPRMPVDSAVCHCGRLVDATVEKERGVEDKPTYKASTQFCPGCGEHVGKHIEQNWYDYQKTTDEYYAEEGQVFNRFRTDALKEVGLTDHPKADKAFSYAWDKGHSCGYWEVFSYLQEIAEVLK